MVIIPKFRIGQGGVVGYTSFLRVVFAANDRNRNLMDRAEIDKASMKGIEARESKIGTKKAAKFREAAISADYMHFATYALPQCNPSKKLTQSEVNAAWEELIIYMCRVFTVTPKEIREARQQTTSKEAKDYWKTPKDKQAARTFSVGYGSDD
ncbi:hypothetical protein MMC32_002793 [Xylographa parallela]|nr:hypothetical protein [Xylographa parallela]